MKKYLVISFDDVNDSYIVEDLNVLIKEIYEFELVQDKELFESVSKKFFSYHKVFEIIGEIKELNQSELVLYIYVNQKLKI